jgi:hypothetical protein
MATDSLEIFRILYNAKSFLIIRQNAHVIWPVKREIQRSCKHYWFTYIATCIQCHFVCLFVCLRFTSRSKNFHLYGHVTITGGGLQNLDLRSALRAFEQGGIFIVPHLLWYRASVFSCLIRRTVPFSRFLRQTRGCGRSILTRILMCLLSVAFYDTQGYVENILTGYSMRRGYFIKSAI